MCDYRSLSKLGSQSGVIQEPDFERLRKVELFRNPASKGFENSHCRMKKKKEKKKEKKKNKKKKKMMMMLMRKAFLCVYRFVFNLFSTSDFFFHV